MSKGILYLCATPIGNLGDMSLRGIEIMKEADLIAAEDTRNSIKLLNHFDIHTPMTSYHEHNRFEKAEELVEMLKEGKVIVCITDAGTPGISDPGEVLVKRCIEEGIEVTSIPGPTALITALILSGFSTRPFRFEGFLPTEKKERDAVLKGLKEDPATLIFYEAPHRLMKTVGVLLEALGDRNAAFCKELTKKHENIRRIRTLYARKLQQTVQAFQRYGKGQVTPQDTRSGISLLLMEEEGLDEMAFCRRGESLGARIIPAEYQGAHHEKHLIFYYNRIPVDEIPELVRQQVAVGALFNVK